MLRFVPLRSRARLGVLAGALLLAAAPAAQAQGSASLPDSLFRRAQRLVAEGEGTAGRALADSLVSAAAPGSPALAEALYWRGALAATAAEAERDYRRLLVEFPLAPRADDALLRLAQMERARGERASAQQRLERFLREHTASPSLGRAAFLLAQLHFEANALVPGCRALAQARGATPASNVELRNQIGFYGGRCEGVALNDSALGAPPSALGDSGTATGTTSVARADSAPATPSAPAASQPRSESRAPSAAPAAPAAPAGRFTVQIAAYNTRAEAERAARRLTARDWDARVYGATKPFRVRVGRFATRAQANEALKKLKAQGNAGFVTEAEPRS